MGCLDFVIPKLMALIINTKVPVPNIIFSPLESFLVANPKRIGNFLFSCKPEALENLARRKVVSLVDRIVTGTPALKKFYREKGVKIEKIRNFADFEKLPETTKENYINKYPLNLRCLGGCMPHNGNIYESAGTSGKPTVWVQSANEADAFQEYINFTLEYTYNIFSKDYILLNCWAFGTWPTAIDFSFAVEHIGEVVNIGTNLEEAIKILKSLGKEKNFIITGYPPFLRNLIDEGKEKGISWKDYNINIITGGEGFVEEWRDYMLKNLKKGSIVRSAYGTTDKGLGEGFETDLTVAIRLLARIMQTYVHQGKEEAEKISKRDFGKILLPENKEKASAFLKELFKVDPMLDSRLPMIFQFDITTYFNQEVTSTDSEGKKISEWVTTVLKKDITSPKVKYNVKDEGGVISFKKMIEVLENNFMGFNEFIEAAGLERKKIIPLPFFHIFGRSDGTVSLDGSNIYPEEIWELIESIPKLNNSINSFVMMATHDHKFGIEFELKHGRRIINSNYYKTLIKQNLPKYSMGYKALVDEKLKSANLDASFNNFGEGLFSEKQSKIKNVYIGKRVKR